MKTVVVSGSDRETVERAARVMLAMVRSGAVFWPEPDPEGFVTLNRGGRAGVAGISSGESRCCAKLFYDTRGWVRWRNRLGFSKARRAFVKGVELARRGVGCPAMMGYAVDRRKGMAVLVTEWADTARRVDHWIGQNGACSDVAAALGLFIRKMHDTGVTHRDLSLRNLLIRPVAAGYEFLLLDYEDARFSSAVSRRARLENLHHLNERALNTVPEEIRREFLSAYLKQDQRAVEEWCRELQQMILNHPSKYTRSSG